MLAMAVGCTSYVEPEDIRNRLESQGYAVGESIRITNTFFEIPATVIPLDDGSEFDPAFDPQIQFYLFDTVEQAKEAASSMSDDGYRFTWGTGTDTSRVKVVEWLLPPTFLLSGDAIAIYLGEDGCVRSVVADQMGEPFAGNREPTICVRL